MIAMKISKKKFQEYARQGIYYINSVWNNELNRVIDWFINDKNYKDFQIKENIRTLVNTSLNLKLKRHDGKFSYIDLGDDNKLGVIHTIYEYNNFLIVHAQYDVKIGATQNNLCIVLYAKGN